MRNFIKIISLCIALVFVVSSFSGCIGNEKKGPEKQVVDKVYKYTTTEIVSLSHPMYENTEDFNGTRYLGYYDVSGDGYIYTIQEVDKNYRVTALTVYMGDAFGNNVSQISLPVAESENGYRNIQNFIRIPDGLLTVVYEHEVVDPKNYIYKNDYYIEIYGLDGVSRSKFNLSDALGVPNDGSSYFGMNQCVYAFGDIFATFYCDDARYTNKVVRLSLDGAVKETISLLPNDVEGYVNRIAAFGDNKLFVPYETYGQEYKQKIAVIDLSSGEKSEFDVGRQYEIMYNSFVGEDGGVYYSNESGIYSVDLVSGESNMLVDFINSDYIYKYGKFYAIDADRFISLYENYENEKTTLNITTFDKVPEDQLTPKYLIKVASAGNAYNFREQIIEFNLASKEHRIQYIDYSQYNTEEDYEAGRKKLNNDIIAGNIPDVLITDEQFSAAKYANKGLFRDIYTFMDNDTELSRDKFLQNILKASEINGKLYELPTNISLRGLMGIKDKISEFGGLTMAQFADKVMSMPEGVSFFRKGDYSRNDLLQLLFFANYSSYINPSTGLCSLNNEDFKSMIRWLGTQPEKAMWEEENFDYDSFDYEAYENMFKEGKAIATWAFISTFDDFSNYVYNFGDNGVELIGAPAPDGDGLVFTSTNLTFLISAKGNFPNEAWEFVKVFFTDENQTSLGWGFPVTKSALDSAKQATLDRIAEREKQEAQLDGGAIIGGTIGGNDIMIEPARRYTTAEDVEKIYGYVTSVNKQLRYEQSIFDIIKEEASEYFGGKKSIDDVAYQAESRVNIKLGEQM